MLAREVRRFGTAIEFLGFGSRIHSISLEMIVIVKSIGRLARNFGVLVRDQQRLALGPVGGRSDPAAHVQMACLC
ncbi:hypothetical protein Asp14428_18830 [Actinoplanes sp. NBRC 14428]|nr:hypothetical protein Asp14428_18830 [Actinoplanes sp. NBRC 14428]